LKAEDSATEASKLHSKVPESREQNQAVVQAMAAMMQGLTSTQQNMLFALFCQQNMCLHPLHLSAFILSIAVLSSERE
jgi:hypothetical protein